MISQAHTASVQRLPSNDTRSMSLAASSSAGHRLSKESIHLRTEHTESEKPLDHSPPSMKSRLSHACLNLPPSFFSINMGTGITSILLYNFPYPAHWLRVTGIIIFVLNIAVFCLLAGGNIARYVQYRGVFRATVTHPLAGMFWGTLPMGLATIVVSTRSQARERGLSDYQNMVAYVCIPAWGKRWAQLALGLWWIDAILSIGVNLGMVFSMYVSLYCRLRMSASLKIQVHSTISHVREHVCSLASAHRLIRCRCGFRRGRGV